MASSALITVYGSSAFAATTPADALAAGRVLDAAALAPFNDLPEQDWTAFAQQRFTSGAVDAQRSAFTALEAVRPNFAKLSPEQAEQALASLLVPGYTGSQSIDQDTWMREIEAQRAAIAAGAKVQVPAETGTFGATIAAPQATRDKIMVITPADDLHDSQVASRVLEAANVLAARPDEQAKEGLAVAL